jgi:dTDP-4-amino-4,6-dideoxy-D-glucose acyltransferase
MRDAFYAPHELIELGVKAHPTVRLSRKASLYGAERIEIAAHARIDDFCILSAGAGGIRIGRNVHVGAASHLIGAGPIELCDFATVSGRVSIYSSNDDYSGAHMTNPTLPLATRRVDISPVSVGRYAIVGCGAVILPGAHLGEGCAIGALSLVCESVPAWKIAVGQPARIVGDRQRGLLRLAPGPSDG